MSQAIRDRLLGAVSVSILIVLYFMMTGCYSLPYPVGGENCKAIGQEAEAAARIVWEREPKPETNPGHAGHVAFMNCYNSLPTENVWFPIYTLPNALIAIAP